MLQCYEPYLFEFGSECVARHTVRMFVMWLGTMSNIYEIMILVFCHSKSKRNPQVVIPADTLQVRRVRKVADF
jgi:hypothetical protein